MGKRKSKTAKQKQKKAAKKLAKSFAKKLGVSVNSKAKKNASGIVVGVVDKNAKVQQRHNRNKSKKVPLASNSPVKSEDFKEFEREQASMREREIAVDWKCNFNSGGRRGKKGRKTSPAIAFQPASFAVSDAEKSTGKLMEEAANQVQHLGGIGRQQPTTTCSSMMHATAVPDSWSAPSGALATHNPWEALDNDNDDPDSLPAASVQPSFQFAPASFSVSKAATIDDVDPDL